MWANAIVMLAALKLPTHPSTSLVDTVLGGLITYAAPVVVLAAFVVAGTKYALQPPEHGRRRVTRAASRRSRLER